MFRRLNEQLDKNRELYFEVFQKKIQEYLKQDLMLVRKVPELFHSA
jgi:hypothetical protein